MHDIFNRLYALHRNIDVSIFLMGKEWSISIKYFDGDRFATMMSLEVKERHADFETALRTAWSRVEDVMRKGLGASRLLPPVDAKAIEGTGVTLAQTFDDTKH